MHWIFYLVAALNISTGLLYIRRRNKTYAILSFLLAIIILLLGYFLKG
jgi:NADH:ubiquinone oxidoreductase subunit 6 (subunit J)